MYFRNVEIFCCHFIISGFVSYSCNAIVFLFVIIDYKMLTVFKVSDHSDRSQDASFEDIYIYNVVPIV